MTTEKGAALLYFKDDTSENTWENLALTISNKNYLHIRLPIEVVSEQKMNDGLRRCSVKFTALSFVESSIVKLFIESLSASQQ